MRQRTLRRIVSGLFVPLVIFVAVVSNAPTKACHCADSKNQAKSICPFAGLRLAAGSITASDSVSIPIQIFVESSTLHDNEEPEARGFSFPATARDPPQKII